MLLALIRAARLEPININTIYLVLVIQKAFEHRQVLFTI